jgi:uncharacterized protein YqhQ
VPNLALQRLTTREPDESMLEVSITALERVLEAEETMPETERVSATGKVADYQETVL